MMFDLYYVVLFTDQGEVAGTCPIYISPEEDVEKELLKNITLHKQRLQSKKEKVFYFDQDKEDMTDLSDHYAHILTFTNNDSQIAKWLEEAHEKLCKTGELFVENGYFQSAFMQYITQKNNVLENYSYEVCEKSVKFVYQAKDYIVIGSEKYELT
ncbi:MULTISPECIES: hypothetical protein [Priestia]|uniref:hypothetical protein n=2 Tax=Priestia TaxID=2800373 RepID=UPI001F21FE27|nr:MULTISPECIES: hypothetical protein [Priestia]MCM3642096.1 hypothetical protein [Priestia aryabhattai]